jgi:hypothetical protein
MKGRRGEGREGKGREGKRRVVVVVRLSYPDPVLRTEGRK